MSNSMLGECLKCGEKAQLPKNTPPFGTSLTCNKCHASLIPVYEPNPGCPDSKEPSEVEAFFGYSGCSLEHPRCPWCQEINYSIVFPELGYKVSWYANRQQVNPQANFVINVECVHCHRKFVVEWDGWPFRSVLRCNFCSAIGSRAQFMTIPENRRNEFERYCGRVPATLPYLYDHGDPLWVACPVCLKTAIANRQRAPRGKEKITITVCDVCNREVSAGDGFFLTTQQVVNTPCYWEYVFNHQWAYYGKMDPKGKSLPLTVRQQVGQNSPWLICEECIHLFNVDHAQARLYCQEWWSSGQSYSPPSTGLGSFREALEAAVNGWEKAFGKVPSGVRVSSKQFEGKTVEEAGAKARAELSEGRIVAQIVIRDSKSNVASGTGNSPEEAVEAAKMNVPAEAYDQNTGKIVQESQTNSMELTAYSEEEASSIWKRGAPEGAKLNNLRCAIAPTRGFLGHGSKAGSWKVEWSTPFIAEITYKTPAVVEVVYEDNR